MRNGLISIFGMSHRDSRGSAAFVPGQPRLRRLRDLEMQGASRDMPVGTPHSQTELFVGAPVEVLFIAHGQPVWYGGKVFSKLREAGKWQVLFDDDD